MKRLLPVLFFAAVTAPALFACGACGSNSPSTAAATATTATTATADHRATLKIDGMTCASCSVTVKTAAKKLDGLESITVDVKAGSASVTFDSNKLSAEDIASKITGAGYPTSVASDQAV